MALPHTRYGVDMKTCVAVSRMYFAQRFFGGLYWVLMAIHIGDEHMDL